MSRLGSLRVILCPPGGEDVTWFAQGLEFDYAAQGDTLEDVLDRFERGLGMTVAEQMRVYGRCILHPAPVEQWGWLYAAGIRHVGSAVVDCIDGFTKPHDFPFGLLSYFGGPVMKHEWELRFPRGREQEAGPAHG